MRHTSKFQSLPFETGLGYTNHMRQVLRIRETLAGSDSVKDAKETYLPMLSGQSSTEYDAYRARAVFFNLSSRVVSTNSGVIVRRPPIVKYNDDMKYYFENDDISKTSFTELFRYTVKELISVGRTGLLMDLRSGKPVILKFDTENILNGEFNPDGSIKQVLLAAESTTLDPKTFEETEIIEFYRLHLVDGEYTITKYREDGEQFSSVTPSIHGRTLSYIPFVSMNVFGLDLNPTKPPMLEIVDLNLSHYRTSADLEHGRHFVGIPQPVITGATSEIKLRVGSEVAWVIPSEKAKAFYLEFIGSGLTSLSDALKEKQAQISQFSAQLMDTSTRGSEAEGTVRMRYSSDAANLSDIAQSAELGLRSIYKMIADWVRTDIPTITLNKDFVSTKLTYQELNALTKSLVDGAITEDVFMYNLERGEMLPTKN